METRRCATCESCLPKWRHLYCSDECRKEHTRLSNQRSPEKRVPNRIHDGRRARPPAIKWADPELNIPTITARGASIQLGVTLKTIYMLVKRGPEHGGLPVYIRAENGVGWIRKTTPRGNADLWFIEEDVKAWQKRQEWIQSHPILTHKKLRQPTYTDEEKQHVLSMYRLLEPITRTAFRKRLTEIDYVKALYPDGRLDTTGWLIKQDEVTGRVYTDSGETVSIVLPARKIEVLKRGAYAWNEYRSYPKLKKILDDAGVRPGFRVLQEAQENP